MLSLTKHPGINKTDIRYRQVSMLYATLIIVACCFAVLALSNLLYFKHFPIAALDTFGCVSAALVYYYARVTGQFRRASWIIITVLMLVLGGFLILTQAAAYALMWLTLLPPIAFFLLGLRSGSYVTGFYAVAVLLYIWRGLDEWELGKLTVGAVLNIGEVILIQWFIFRHYEKSRTEAFQLLQDSASTDRLTRLWNRVRLDEFLLDTLAQAGRAELFTAVILLDIDNFKTINDERGHLCGDTVLVSLAKELRACVRQTDRVGRWGGKSF